MGPKLQTGLTLRPFDPRLEQFRGDSRVMGWVFGERVSWWVCGVNLGSFGGRPPPEGMRAAIGFATSNSNSRDSEYI